MILPPLVFIPWNNLFVLGQGTLTEGEGSVQLTMDKLQLTGRNLSRVLFFRSGHLYVVHLWCYQVKLPNLKLITLPKTTSKLSPLRFCTPQVDFLIKLALWKELYKCLDDDSSNVWSADLKI